MKYFEIRFKQGINVSNVLFLLLSRSSAEETVSPGRNHSFNPWGILFVLTAVESNNGDDRVDNGVLSIRECVEDRRKRRE